MIPSPYLVLLCGVLIAATSSILVRLAQAEGAPSLVIAGGRMVMAVLILTPITWRQGRQELRRLQRNDLGWSLAGGIFLAAHLGTWIASLEFTSVASSTALVTTYPLWVALVSFLLFRERLTRYTIFGLATALSGSLLITLSDGGVISFDPSGLAGVHFNWQHLITPAGKANTTLLGNSLALVGAMTGAGYFLVGRNLRTRLSNTVYVWLVYTGAMMVLLGVMLLNRQSLFGYSSYVYVWIMLIGIGPQLLGHTAFNWALAHLSATFIVLTILGEPLGSAVFAYFFFGETFAPLQLIGFVLLLAGIGLGVRGEQR